jgi:hypothetical protein
VAYRFLVQHTIRRNTPVSICRNRACGHGVVAVVTMTMLRMRICQVIVRRGHGDMRMFDESAGPLDQYREDGKQSKSQQKLSDQMGVKSGRGALILRPRPD